MSPAARAVPGALADPGAAPGRAQRAVRRTVVYVLLFVLVQVAGNGIAGLLARVLGAASPAAGQDVSGLALQLTFALVGAPLAGILWWFVWRSAHHAEERSSVGWGLYIAAMYTFALVYWTTALLGLLSGLAAGGDEWWAGGAGMALVWAAIWAWHRWMWRHSSRGPLRLADVPGLVGWAYGIVIVLVSGSTALGGVIGAAIDTIIGTAGSFSAPWWRGPLASAIWAAGGSLLWWWHWTRERTCSTRTVLADVGLVAVGIFGPAGMSLGGAGTVLYVLLRLLFDRTGDTAALLGPLPSGIAAGLVGAAVWAFHHPLAAERRGSTRAANQLAVAGVALAGAASGLGVVLNSLLALAVSPLAGSGPRPLLLGGLASLAVGLVAWWWAWRPGHPADPHGRRVYLVVVFGASAVVALVALLVLGFRLFESLLEGGSGDSLLERTRAPFGLLVATGLVAAYHYAVWRGDRLRLAPEPAETAPAAEPAGTAGSAEPAPAGPGAFGRAGRLDVFLVAPQGAVSDGLVRELRGAGASDVVLWPRADATETPTAPDASAVLAAVRAAGAERVLVVVGPSGSVEAIPLSAP